jgi:WD40 repeat protein
MSAMSPPSRIAVLLTVLFSVQSFAGAPKPTKGGATRAPEVVFPVEQLWAQVSPSTVPVAGKVRELVVDGGARTFAVSAGDNTLQLFDLQGRAPRLSLRSETSSPVALSPDGTLIAAKTAKELSHLDDQASPTTVIIWNAQSGEQVHALTVPCAYVQALRFSPDGRSLAISNFRYVRSNSIEGWKTFDCGIHIHDLKDVQTPARVLGGEGTQVMALEYTADGRKLIAASSDGKVRLWDIATGSPLVTNDGSWRLSSLATSRDGALTAVAGKPAEWNTVFMLRIVDATNGQVLKRFGQPSGSGFSSELGFDCTSLAFLPDPELLACGSPEGEIRLADWRRGVITATLGGHDGAVTALRVSPDGNTLLSGGADGSVRLWPLLPVAVARFIARDPFETAKEHGARVRAWSIEHSIRVKLVAYDVDAGKFQVQFQHKTHPWTVAVPVPREEARRLGAVGGEAWLTGQLRFRSAKMLALTDLRLDTTSSAPAPSASLPPVSAPVTPTASRQEDVPAPPGVSAPPDVSAPPVVSVGPRENDVAVVIGIERYKQLPRSDYSVADASLVKKYLLALGFQERNIELLVDDSATFSAMRKTLETWLPNRVKPGSRLFIYYSGHGAPDAQTGEPYLVPYDGDASYLSDTGYPLERLYTSLGKVPAAEVVVVLDSCFSGSGGRSVLAPGTRPLIVLKEPAVPRTRIAVLSSTESSQISTSSPEVGHGLFTYYFLRALQDGKKSVGDIYTYVKPQVEDAAKRRNVTQRPAFHPGPDSPMAAFTLWP